MEYHNCRARMRAKKQVDREAKAMLTKPKKRVRMFCRTAHIIAHVLSYCVCFLFLAHVFNFMRLYSKYVLFAALGSFARKGEGGWC